MKSLNLIIDFNLDNDIIKNLKNLLQEQKHHNLSLIDNSGLNKYSFKFLKKEFDLLLESPFSHNIKNLVLSNYNYITKQQYNRSYKNIKKYKDNLRSFLYIYIKNGEKNENVFIDEVLEDYEKMLLKEYDNCGINYIVFDLKDFADINYFKELIQKLIIKKDTL